MKRNHCDAFEDHEEKSGDGPLPGLLPTVEMEGVQIPKFFERNWPMREHIECIRALEMRPDDIIICAYVKSGTHWLWEVCSMLLSGRAEYNHKTKEHLTLEATDVEQIQLEPSPRILNTHLPVSMLPREVKDKRVKVVHMYRNVKDVFVSMYHHVKQIPGAETVSLDALEGLFYSSYCPSGNYFTYLHNVDSFMKNNPDIPVFNVSFEDMKELSHQVAQACSFDRLKEANKFKQQTEDIPVDTYRTGEVGDWKNYLTVTQSERFDSFMRQLQGCNFRFRYTL